MKNNYTAPAGGWGALKSTTEHLIKSKNVFKNIKSLLRANQSQGFDCPGCAWGEEQDPSRIRFCENGAKAINWEATSKGVGREFFAEHTVRWLNEQTDYFLEFQGRLTEPMRYNAATDKYLPISWESAFSLIAQHLQQLNDPNQLELYTSGRASNEAAFLYQLFGRAFGTNNFPDCSNMCHEASGVALGDSIGIGKGTVTLHDFDKADTIFVFGQNPGTNHPRMLDTLRSAMKRGCNVVIFNTLKERGLEKFQHPQNPIEMLSNSSTTMHSYYFTPKLGGDMAAVRGIVKVLLEKHQESIDQNFLDQHTTGLEGYLTRVQNTEWQQIYEQSGLSHDEIELAARLFAESKHVISTWAMGITQHYHSVATIHEIVNFMALGGHIGKPGSGLCPVRGHSNVQGDRTMGINERPAKAFLDRLDQTFTMKSPRHHGHAAVEAIQAMLAGSSKVFIGLGGNFAAATPDTVKTAQALSNCDLTVQISTKLNRSHLVTGKEALILPCLGRTDIDYQKSGSQCITVEDSFSMVHASEGVQVPLSSEMRSEPAIIAGIANAVLGTRPVKWLELAENYDRIRDLIEAVIPGFDGFNRRIREPGGFYLGNSARNRVWNTPANQLTMHDFPLPQFIIPALADASLQEGVLILQTLRSHDQYNTTIYGMDDRYRGVRGERRVVFIHPDDIRARGYQEGQMVSMRSLWPDGQTREVHGFKLVAYDISLGNIAAYYPETNPLVPLESVGEGSGTPTSKSVAVELFESKSDVILRS
ncbi:FdhF/YdeP family oxidoreductase [Neptunomonas sp. XY-337]|uniref:FdhF/YdeP family oxidoreductase n=1 Tax=Neptunomonas sp. XY-337 TaxID=2561897 RepID=UPI0010AA2EA2|nr:FdhF/YdeP family oxidoreductase [Neptunomonas sp. XY-337]